MMAQTLHVKLTGAMVLVLILDGIAYLLAVHTVAEGMTTGRAAFRHLRRGGAPDHLVWGSCCRA